MQGQEGCLTLLKSFYKLFLRDSGTNRSCCVLRSISLFKPLKFVISVFFDDIDVDVFDEEVTVSLMTFFSDDEFPEELWSSVISK